MSVLSSFKKNERCRSRLPALFTQPASNNWRSNKPRRGIAWRGVHLAIQIVKGYFWQVLNIILPDISDGEIPHLLKFATCLRYYATGSTQLIHADLHSISQPMVSRIVRDVSVALASRHGTYIYFPPDLQGKRDVCAKFCEQFRINNVIGAIDFLCWWAHCSLDSRSHVPCLLLIPKYARIMLFFWRIIVFATRSFLFQ